MNLQEFEIEETAEEIALQLKELALIALLIFDETQAIMQTLRSGRAPIKLDIPSQLEPIQISQQTFEETLQTLETSLQKYLEWRKTNTPSAITYAKEEDIFPLLEALDAVKLDWNKWLEFSESAKIMLSRLKLISEAERLSSGAWASLLDAWEELENLANNGTLEEEVTV